MGNQHGTRGPSEALQLLASERPRNVSWMGAAGMLFGDWGTSRLYLLGLAFLVAGRSSIYLIAAMSVLLICVGWAYTQICRIFPDGGGVYTAGKQRARLLGVVGALLLFAGYTVTASISALEAFHYFGLTTIQQHDVVDVRDAGDQIILVEQAGAEKPPEELWHPRSPVLWGIVAILGVGAFNLLGPKHSAKFATTAAVAMVIVTLVVVAFAFANLDWGSIRWGRLEHPPFDAWQGFVSIVLALSGVEAIANLTGVMKKPVHSTARKSIWVVTLEVAIVNLLVSILMVAYSPGRTDHVEDMLAYIAGQAMGPLGEWPVRIIGGLLLLSATNTAINGLMSMCYVMSRDGELPAILQKLNGFGAPYYAAAVATTAPIIVLFLFNDLTSLAALYAIGVVGAITMNCSLCSLHPRLRRIWRKVAVASLALLLVAIFITLAATRVYALVFIAIVVSIGLLTRWANQYVTSRKPKLSLFRQAIVDQITPDAWNRPRLLVATAGSSNLAEKAIQHAREQGATLVVSFVREVSLNFTAGVGERMNIDTDPAAQAMFVDFLELGAKNGVPIVPTYDVGPDAATLIAEAAAMNAVQEVLIGTSRRGRLHRIIRGSFQRKLESLLPPEITVRVIEVSAQ